MDDEKITREISNIICKSILYICIAVFAGTWALSCNLDDGIILSCQEACKKSDSYMESVTSSKCVCGKSGSLVSSPFVIPGG